MGISRSTSQPNPMEESRFHRVLVLTNNLQRYPSWIFVALMVMFAGIVDLAWVDTSIVPALYLLAAAFNWVLLWLLPRLGRSYGPDRPVALALAALMLVLVLPPGLLRAPDWIGAGLLLSITLLAFYATYIEPFNLRVTREVLRTPHFDAAAPPLRLLHIGDIHIERISPREKRLNHLINELKPDLIVFSGDFVNLSYTWDDRAFHAVRETIGAWRAPLGVYCVPGTYTVEPLERVKQFVAGLDNLTLLLNRWISLDTAAGRVHLLGMITTHILATDQQSLIELQEKSPPSPGFRLLLTHAPDVAPEADAAGMDLYLCGHTHGGQIRLPLIGAVFSGSHLGMRFVIGRHDLERTTVYTTRGVGLEGLGAPRARFLCPPEIILWEIQGGK